MQGKVFLHTLKIYCIITQLRLVFIIMTVSPQSEIYLGHIYKMVIEYILERCLLILIELRFFSTPIWQDQNMFAYSALLPGVSLPVSRSFACLQEVSLKGQHIFSSVKPFLTFSSFIFHVIL